MDSSQTELQHLRQNMEKQYLLRPLPHIDNISEQYIW